MSADAGWYSCMAVDWLTNQKSNFAKRLALQFVYCQDKWNGMYMGARAGCGGLVA